MPLQTSQGHWNISGGPFGNLSLLHVSKEEGMPGLSSVPNMHVESASNSVLGEGLTNKQSFEGYVGSFSTQVSLFCQLR